MPLHKLPIRRIHHPARPPNPPPPQPHQPPRRRTPPTHPPGHQHAKPTPLPLQPHRPAIQRLVMHTAQRQPIGNHIAAIVGMPPDVRGLQSEQAVAEPDVVLTHGTSFFVRLEDTLAEPAVPRCVLPDLPPSSWHRFVKSEGGCVRGDSHGLQDVLMDRWRKVLGQDPASSAGHEFRVAAQQIVNILPESARDPKALRFADEEVFPLSRPNPTRASASSSISGLWGARPPWLRSILTAARRARNWSGVTMTSGSRRSGWAVLFDPWDCGKCNSNRDEDQATRCQLHLSICHLELTFTPHRPQQPLQASAPSTERVDHPNLPERMPMLQVLPEPRS